MSMFYWNNQKSGLMVIEKTVFIRFLAEEFTI